MKYQWLCPSPAPHILSIGRISYKKADKANSYNRRGKSPSVPTWAGERWDAARGNFVAVPPPPEKKWFSSKGLMFKEKCAAGKIFTITGEETYKIGKNFAAGELFYQYSHFYDIEANAIYISWTWNVILLSPQSAAQGDLPTIPIPRPSRRALMSTG